jgi:hypothetical protein
MPSIAKITSEEETILPLVVASCGAAVVRVCWPLTAIDEAETEKCVIEHEVL